MRKSRRLTPRFVSLPTLCQVTGLSTHTIRKAIDSGLLRATKLAMCPRPQDTASAMPKGQHGYWYVHIDDAESFLAKLRGGLVTRDDRLLGKAKPLPRAALVTGGAGVAGRWVAKGEDPRSE